MAFKVNCFVLFLMLVVELLCAPSPEKYEIRISHGAAAQTYVRGGADVNANLNGRLVNGTGSAKLGAAGSTQLDASVYVQLGDKKLEANTGYDASAGGYVNPSAKGKLGIKQNGKGVASGNTNWRSNSELSSAGNAGINTGDDAAPEKYNEYKKRTADEVLNGMTDDNDNN